MFRRRRVLWTPLPLPLALELRPLVEPELAAALSLPSGEPGCRTPSQQDTTRRTRMD
jgi:hypothetical protein